MLHKLSRLINKSVNTKITLIVVTMTLLISGLIGIVSIVNHRQQIIDLKTEQAAKVAQMAAILIDGDKFAEMAAAEAENEYYDEVKSILSNMKTASGVVYLYSVIPDSQNQIIRYIAEGQTADDDPEDIYDFNTEEEYGITFELETQIAGFDAAYASSTIFDSGMYTDEKYGLLETVYAPILGSDGKVKGMVGADIDAKKVVTEANQLMFLILIIAACGFAAMILLSRLMIRRLIIKPLKKIVSASEALALGDVSVNVQAESADEIGQMAKSFQKMVVNIREQSLCAEMIAAGRLDVQIAPKSENDILSRSLINVSQNIRNLSDDIFSLTTAAVEGRLQTRAEVARHQGDYAKLIEGVNATLDAVTGPIAEAADVLQEMSYGNLQKRVVGQYQGENAMIKDALNSTLDALEEYISEISTVLEQMAGSNFAVTINSDYRGDFAAIKTALNLIVDSLNGLLSDMNSAADQVSSSSLQVSDGSQMLAQGASEQAGSIQELNAGLSEVTKKVRQSATAASQASNLAAKARTNAIEGNRQMNELVKAMAEINESS